MFAEMKTVGKLERDDAKGRIISILYGADGTSDKNKVGVRWWNEMCTEFESIARQIATHGDYKDTLEICRAKNAHNLNASTMCCVMNDIECKCLEALYTCLEGRHCIPDGKASLIFDGMMIPDTPKIRARVLDEGGKFLKEASQHIFEKTGYNIQIIEKKFDQGLELPEGYADTVEDTLILEGKQDRVAALEFIRRYSHRLVTCDGRVFWEVTNSIFTEDKKEVNNGVLGLVQKMQIFMSDSRGNLTPYSENRRHALDCVGSIFADVDKLLEQPDFIDRLARGNIGYLPFEDGIYDFEQKRLREYPIPGVVFLSKINRKFPGPNVTDGARMEVNCCSVCLVNREGVLTVFLIRSGTRSLSLRSLARSIGGSTYIASPGRPPGW